MIQPAALTFNYGWDTSQRGHGKEIHCGDCFAMVGQESKPPLARIAAASEPLQISGDSTLGDREGSSPCSFPSR